MLNTSTDVLLIVIAICVAFFTGFLCYFIYNLTQTVKQGTKTVEDVNKKLEKIDPLVDDLTETVGSLTGTIQNINNNVLKPVASLSTVFKKIKNITGIFSKDKA